MIRSATSIPDRRSRPWAQRSGMNGGAYSIEDERPADPPPFQARPTHFSSKVTSHVDPVCILG